MAYTLTARAPGASNLTAKNCVWDFFANSNKPRPANRRQSPQPRRKIRPTPTKNASGIPYWPSRDPIGEEGGVNLYAFVENEGVLSFDVLGERIFSNESEALREKFSAALQKVAKGTYRWCPISETDIKPPMVKDYEEKTLFVLLADEEGNGQFWSDLSPAFSARAPQRHFLIIEGNVENNAGGANTGLSIRRIIIPLAYSGSGPVDKGRKEADGKTPIYDTEPQSYEAMVWHELVGHGIKGLGHPEKKWNTYEFKDKKRSKTEQENWDKGDPTVAYENTVKKFLGESPRRPQYWEKESDWPKNNN